jgi:hypothetical protein
VGHKLRGHPRRQREQADPLCTRPRRRRGATPQTDPVARPRRCLGTRELRRAKPTCGG